MPWNLIPQIFFDLIARIAPGAIILMVGWLTFLGPVEGFKKFYEASSKTTLLSFSGLVIGFIFSYLLGFILYGLWEILFENVHKKLLQKGNNPIKTALKYHNMVRMAVGLRPLKFEDEALPPHHVMYNQLRLHSETESYRFVKLRAERIFGQALFVGFLFLSIINVGYWISGVISLNIDRALLEIFLILSMYSFWKQSSNFRRYYIHGTCVQWLFFNFPINLQSTVQLESAEMEAIDDDIINSRLPGDPTIDAPPPRK